MPLRLLPFPLLVLLAAPLAVLSQAPDPDAGLYLLLAPPWRDAEAIARAAGGWPVGPVRAPLGLMVEAPSPGFPARAAALGARAIDGRSILVLCKVPA